MRLAKLALTSALLAFCAFCVCAQTVQMQCRPLKGDGSDFLGPNETYVNGMACRKVTVPAPAVPAAKAQIAPEPAVATVRSAEVLEKADPKNPSAPIAESKPPVEAASAFDQGDVMTDSEVEAAMREKPKLAVITQGTSIGQELLAGMANVNLVQEASIRLATAESWLAGMSQAARREYEAFTPSRIQRMHGIVVVGQAAAFGSYSGPHCASIDRIVLISDREGTQVAEPIHQVPISSTWMNGFGARATCSSLVARFAQKDLDRVSAAARNGEYFVAVFSGISGKYVYQVKRKFQRQFAEE